VSAAGATAVTCALVLRSASHGTLIYWFGGWHPGNGIGLGIAFGVDAVGASVALGVALITIAALFFAHRLFDDVGALFDVLVLVHLGAAVAFVYTADLFDLLVFYELTNVAEFALAGYRVTKRIAVRGAFNFAIATGFGAFAIIFGLTLLEGKSGQLNAAAIGESLLRAPSPVLAACAFGLIATGLLVKAAVPPFHFWFVDAQTAAPAPVGVLFSGVACVLGIYALERTWTTTFALVPGARAPVVHDVLAVLGVVAALLAAGLAFTSADLKRALAFAASANTALLAAATVTAGDRSIAAAACLAIGFVFPVAALAMWIGILENELGTVLDDDFGGRARILTPTIVLAALAIAGIAGVPPVPSALGRALLSGPLAFCSVVTGGLTAARFARAAWQAYGIAPAGEIVAPARDPGRWFLLGPALALAAAAFVAGAVPWPALAAAIVAFADPHAMAQALLHQPLPLPRPSLAQPRSGDVLLWAAATLALAVVAAAVRGPIRKLALVHRLHAVHNGSVGDYVTWLAGGAAAITAIFVVWR
jgi:multicomponent Na+:H+ antiporter subunit D